MSANPCLEKALEYRKRGWGVVPVDGESKSPCVAWTQYQTQRASEKKIREWWQQFPGASVGVVTGQVSGLAALDLDFPANDATAWGVLQGQAGYSLPPTPCVHTPSGGRHFYFRHPGHIEIGRHIKFLGEYPAVDLFGKGFLVAPPSQRKDGTCYEWDADLGTDIELAELPVWVLEHVLSTSPVRGQRRNIPSVSPSLGDEPHNGIFPTPAGCGFQGEALAAWDTYLPFVQAAARLVGIPAVGYEHIGTPFCCVLPLHTDKHPSASLYVMHDSKTLYRDWHAASGEEWYTLAETFASQYYRRAVKLSPFEQAVWHLRLLIECGFAAPLPVSVPELPPNAPKAERRVYDGMRLLLGTRGLYEPARPAPFGREFGAAWCQMTPRNTGEAFQSLLQQGYFVRADTIRSKGHSLMLFSPGSEKLVNSRRGKQVKKNGVPKNGTTV